MDFLPSTDIESEVRYYCRKFPALFARARGAELFDTGGKRFIDFFGGCGALNYGHNHPELIAAITRYLEGNGILHSLDLRTEAKQRFIETLQSVILQPRGLKYRVQFPGPTGANAVEAAIKLARKVTGRTQVVAFTGAFHGVTLGALSLTSSASHRNGAGMPLNGVVRMPFDGFLRNGDELSYVEQMLTAAGNGHDRPAAFILETVQGEGGLNAASAEWLRGIQRLANDVGALLIVDEVLAGCGRTGTFFSFEAFDIQPDIICLSKSLSGLGLPLSLVLMRPDHDVWNPGEHNGTFRGNNLAFVAAVEAFGFWRDDAFLAQVQSLADRVRDWTVAIERRYGAGVALAKGRGALCGVALDAESAAKVQAAAFSRGLLIETSGADDSVLKLLPPLNIEPSILEEGLDILDEAISSAIGERPNPNARTASASLHS